MPVLRRVDLGRREEYYRRLDEFAASIKETLPVEEVILFGSFATGEIHEGSDIDLIVIGDFKERFHERIGKIMALTDLPIEPLVYTRQEFEEMKAQGNSFILEVVKTGRIL
ncbi:MAG: nucleotidyltransferase domain-containing protein [Dehalococcoidia bacterium]